MTQSAYQKLEAKFAQINALSGASSILHWDSAAMMPEGANDVRGEQLAALAEVCHEKITAPEIADLLNEAEAQKSSLNDWQQVNLEEMRRSYIHENAVPVELVSALTKASSESEMNWRTARKENDFKSFAKYFEPLLKLVREAAKAKAAALKCSEYDALLDQYDPSTKSADIDPLFADLKKFLPPLVSEVIEHQKRAPAPIELEGPFDIATQKNLGLDVMKALGFDFNHGRLDESHHPFCGGVSGDIRITTRYKTDNFTESFFGVMHETGHALYDMGLPKEWRQQPVGGARGMSMHESQSLTMEMQLGLSRPFLEYIAPRMQKAFGGNGAAWTPDNIARVMTKVERSLIRVTADEVTYPLHVILRYEMEKALLSGDLKASDLPGAWNEKMKAYLGITPPDDKDGCMQDIHWAGGSIGYFPTYTLGAMIAAQLMDAAKRQVAGLEGTIRDGKFFILTNWLKENVHSKASRFSTPEIIQQATGKPLSADIYKAHLKQRYLA